MTTETTGAETTTDQTTNQDTQQGTTQNSTDQSPEAIAAAAALAGQQADQQQTQQTPEEKAAADAAAAAAAETDKPAEGAAAWPADLDEELKKFVGDKTPAQVAKELQAAQALIGKKSIGIPTKDSTPEEHRAFHKARGVPETEAEYSPALAPVLAELKTVAPEGWAPSAELEASFARAAKLSNLSTGEAKEFAKHYLTDQFEQRKEFVAKEVAATKEASALLASAWGADRTVGEANFARGMKAVGLPAESVDVFLAAYGGNGQARFALVNAVAEIGRRQTEGGPIPGQGDGGQNTAMTKEQATAEVERIKKDPVLSAAFMDVTNPRHKEVTAEMTRLGKIQRGIT
jgi:hypothetical protein